MFGGLDVKGSSSQDKKEEKSQSSAFSFMGKATTTSAAKAPAADASGFSFMGSTSAAPVSVPETKEPSSSGFSFMGDGAPARAAPKPAETTSNVNSGFNFLQTPVAPAPAHETELKAPSSSFGFMSTTAAAAPEPTPGIGLNVMVPSSLSGDAAGEQPVGAGMVFGGAVVQTKKPIKKRSRAQKVGSARAADLPAAVISAPPRPSYASAPPPVPTSTSPSPPRPAQYGGLEPPYPSVSPPNAPYVEEEQPVMDTKEAALEAAARAEEFMAQKMQQTSGYVEDYGPSPSARAPIVWARSPEDDDDYAAAVAAAEEARAMTAKQHSHQGDGLGLGRFFSRNKSPWSGSNSTGSGVHSQQSHNETPAERMQREQEEIKRAVAERQLAMQQEQSSQKAYDDEDMPTNTVEPPAVETSTPLAWGSSTAFSSMPRSSSWTRPTVMASPPTPPPPPKTPAQKLEEILSAFENKVKRAMERVAQMRDQHKGLLDERYLSLAKERLAVQSMAAAEAQQMAAAEAEDYDMADRLAAVIDGYAREKSELATILENISRALAELDSQKQKMVSEVAYCFDQLKQELESFHEDQKTNDKKDDTEAMTRFSTTSKHLSGEHGRLLSDAKHLERDENLVAEERKDLEMSISEQTADMEKQRDSTRATLMTIEEEIEILRRQLEAKEATAAKLRSEVDSFEKDIEKIREKFARQLTRVEKKEASVKENRHEWEKEKIAYESLKIAHEEEVKAHSEALLAHNDLMQRLKREITLAGTFESIVAKEVGFEKNANEDLESDGDFAHMQADLVKCEAAVSEGRQLLKAAEAAMMALKEERNNLIERVPALEEMKNAAAARRDFKAAGKASKQIKDATTRLKECEEELLGEASERAEAALEDLERAEEELKKTKAVSREKEREAGKIAMEKVAEKIRRLVEIKSSVCGGESDESSVQAVGAFVLDGQIEALVREGSAYGEKFGGWDDIAKELTDSGLLDGTKKASAVDHKQSAEGEPAGGRPQDEVDLEIVAKFRALTKRLQEVEEAIDAAAEAEDYKTAEELTEELEEIRMEWEAIELTAAEMEVFAEDEPELERSAAYEAQTPESSDEPEVVESDEETEGSAEDDDELTSESSGDVGVADSGYESEGGTELADNDAPAQDETEAQVDTGEPTEDDDTGEVDAPPDSEERKEDDDAYLDENGVKSQTENDNKAAAEAVIIEADEDDDMAAAENATEP